MPRKRKKKKRRKLPPLDYDPQKYDWVNTREGGYPRRKKGTVKPVKLNNTLQKNVELTRPTNEAAKRVMAKLYPFLQYLKLGRTVVRIAGRFKKSINKNGQMDYTSLEGLDFQDDYRLADTAWGLVSVREKAGVLYLLFPVGNMHVKKHSSLATGYYVEFILLSGSPEKENVLRIDSTESRLYTFEEEGNVDCHLSMQLPEKEPWMALLKVSCTFEKEVADTPKYYGLKVVKVGKGQNS
ncbi:hypothetical protein HB364_07220 [Pseudoflavitalea sp. X16]|uniref:hypothetical protein n=1 Tax=Paraflavitalea devenefica TaxID=2716334 RepID=UPI00142164E8|nr:hypothetical protein [Paraflavitalea devenefica]NII24861.1 hypothetical protein [Paraflavitalea devenefica]